MAKLSTRYGQAPIIVAVIDHQCAGESLPAGTAREVPIVATVPKLWLIPNVLAVVSPELPDEWQQEIKQRRAGLSIINGLPYSPASRITTCRGAMDLGCASRAIKFTDWQW